MTETDPLPPPVMSRTRRILMMIGGFFFVGLATLGVILPVLPTTPFLLLASGFFLKSSPASNQWLLRSRIFGPFLRDWQERKGVRLSVKVTAIAMILIVVTVSIFSGKLSQPLLITLLVLAAIGLIVVIKLPLVRDDKNANETPENPQA